MTGQPLPSAVIVRTEPPARGAPEVLTFYMTYKNPYNCMYFVGADGTVRVEAHELLYEFGLVRQTGLMDYASPDKYFSGRVTAELLDAAGLERLKRAMKLWSLSMYRPGFADE